METANVQNLRNESGKSLEVHRSVSQQSAFAIHFADAAPSSTAQIGKTGHFEREQLALTAVVTRRRIEVAAMRDIMKHFGDDILVSNVVCYYRLCRDWPPNLILSRTLEAQIMQLVPPPVQGHQRPRREVEEHTNDHIFTLRHHGRPSRRCCAALEIQKVVLLHHPRCYTI